MSQVSNYFNYSIVIYYYDENGLIKTLLGDTSNFNSLYLRFRLNEFPYAKLILEYPNFTELTKIQDYHVQIVIKNNITMEFDIGMTNWSSVGNIVTIEGFLCKSDKFLSLDSEFLGYDLISSIKKLGFSQELKFDQTISGKFYRINNNRLSCLIKLLSGLKLNSSFIISEKDINIINMNDTELYSEKLDNNLPKVTYSDSYSRMNIIMDTTKYYGISEIYNHHIYFRRNSEFYKNIMTNCKFMDGLELMSYQEYQDYLPIYPGKRILFQFNNLVMDKFIVVGKELYFTNELKTTLEIGTYKNAFK